MKEQSKRPFRLAALFLAAGVLLAAAAVLSADTSRRPEVAPIERAQPAQDDPPPLSGTFFGTVALEWAMPGAYGDPLPTPTPDPGGTAPPDLGEIDFALFLVQSGGTVTGYVDLEFTLVFTTEHTVDGTAYGPAVQGTYVTPTLTIESERISLLTSGQRLMRQFRLSGELAPDEESLSGEYRETLWGYGPQPLTVIGTFTLRKAAEEEVYEKVYLPLVLKSGP